MAFPTETVYGLGADATDGKAIARLYAAKGRPAFNPLIVHVADQSDARRLARFDTSAERLGAALWPGPLTLVLPKQDGGPIADLVTAGLDTIALRVPSHPVARDLLAAFGGPIAAPSANRSGHVSPTSAQHVVADLDGRIDLILDGGAANVGVESTIVACLGGKTFLLRAGGSSRASIEAALGRSVDEPPADLDAKTERGPLAPGQLVSHYAPNAGLRLDVNNVEAGEALLAFGPALLPGTDNARSVLNLSFTGDVIEAAANLFSHLRELDRSGAATIAVMPIPRDGLGEAINDRLTRAARR